MLPLIVDLDGTLSRVDTLHETLILLLLRRPSKAAQLGWLLARYGRAAMKARVAADAAIDATGLPLNTEFVAWLEAQAKAGRPLHLVSAANSSVVEAIADRLKIFTSWRGSDGAVNLKGKNKAAYLTQMFPDGFAYAGDSAADLDVWTRAGSIVLVNASDGVASRAEALGRPVEARFDGHGSVVKAFLKECRLHQWSKNALVFLPILLAHRFHDLSAWGNALLAFLALSVAASATYMINDLFDLSADRRHATKKRRPLASGALPIAFACVGAPLLLVAGCILAANANLTAFGVMLIYLALTLSYSFRFKQVPLFDTTIIGLLFTLRIVMGCAATDIQPSPWLLAFSVMLFFSLAMAKRQTELSKKMEPGSEKLAGRGYHVGDAVLSLVYGVTSGVASLVILMLYITSGVGTGLYSHPNWLWGMPLMIYFWQMRIWLLAHRGVLDDDPIVFALKDRVSLLLGAGCAIVFYLAL